MSMFSQAVSSLSRLGSWNTTPKRLRTSVACVTGLSPSSSSVPLVGRSTVVSILIVVVLPAPFGPRNANVSPRRTSNVTSLTAVTVPNVRTRCWTRMMWLLSLRRPPVPARARPRVFDRGESNRHRPPFAIPLRLRCFSLPGPELLADGLHRVEQSLADGRDLCGARRDDEPPHQRGLLGSRGDREHLLLGLLEHRRGHRTPSAAPCRGVFPARGVHLLRDARVPLLHGPAVFAFLLEDQEAGALERGDVMVESRRRLAEDVRDLLGGLRRFGEQLHHAEPQRMRERAQIRDGAPEHGRPRTGGRVRASHGPKSSADRPPCQPSVIIQYYLNNQPSTMSSRRGPCRSSIGSTSSSCSSEPPSTSTCISGRAFARPSRPSAPARASAPIAAASSASGCSRAPRSRSG